MRKATGSSLTTLAVLASLTLGVGAALTGVAAARHAAIEEADRELAAAGAALAFEVGEIDPAGLRDTHDEVAAFAAHHPGLRVALTCDGAGFSVGDPVAEGTGPADEVDSAGGGGLGGEGSELGGGTSVARMVGAERVVVTSAPGGARVAVARPIDPQGALARNAARWVLGLLLAAAAVGWAAGRAARRASRREVQAELAGLRIRQAEMLSNASHELKTPLTSMRTNVELVMQLFRQNRLDQLPEEERAALERDVLAQMQELSSLISDFSDMGREDAPGNVATEFRLDEVLEEALERTKRRRKDVSFFFSADPWVMHGDRDAMVRVPVNLFDNAAKWSPANGTVRISLTAAQTEAVLLVDDSGPGIPPAERDRVFQRFYRTTEARATPGSGLGLAITKQVLERHGCEVEVGESDDGGARIRVVFPGHPPAGLRRNGAGGFGGRELGERRKAALSKRTGNIAKRKPTRPVRPQRGREE